MPKHGKNYKNSLAQIEKGKVYTAGEAVELLKKITFEKFDATVSVSFKLNVFSITKTINDIQKIHNMKIITKDK